jgi:hypothetical protein
MFLHYDSSALQIWSDSVLFSNKLVAVSTSATKRN